MTANCGDSGFSNDVRNPNSLVGSVPNATDDISEKYASILEQRERIIESFMAEHAGLKPSQIRQIIRELPNGDVEWHVEKI